MDQRSLSSRTEDDFAAGLREALARCDLAFGSVTPVLRHLVSDTESSLFHDEVLARVRGMLDDIAAQLLRHFMDAGGHPDDSRIPLDALEALTQALSQSDELLGHLHALALEWRLTERLQSRRLLEPVLSPLLQSLIGASDEALAGSAMRFLTAQARFVQAARRLEIDLSELPSEVLHSAISALRKHGSRRADTRRQAQAAIRAIQARYDEAETRLGRAAELLSHVDVADQTLDIERAGLALFASGLALEAKQPRDAIICGSTEGQGTRLALTLRAAGCDHETTERCVLALHPDADLPDGLETIDRHSAAAMLDGKGGAK